MRSIIGSAVLVYLAGSALCFLTACRIDGQYYPIDAAPDADAVETDGSVPPGMIVIPGGPFLRGCNHAVEDCTNLPDQVPLAMIEVSTFAIDETEVTQAAYKRCMDAGICAMPAAGFDPLNKGAHPVASVTWQQAQDYCAYDGKRLPTEAEWEKASRGADGRKYPWGNFDPTCQLAHYLDCALGGTSPLPVASRGGDSPYGLKDMSGNIIEWINDWHDNQYYYLSPTTDPQGPPAGTRKVIRGGGFSTGTRYLRSSDRGIQMPAVASVYVGFRCARSW